ncbi:MAG: hypothetical protein J5724_01655 [Ruminococcus sp.]|nr:hypothetical protein [Ruminococcus sp.]
MEELLAYAYLIGEGYSLESFYESKLNELFIANPNNSDLLELEFLSDNIMESIIYIKTHINYTKMNKQAFGKQLMTLLKPIYASTELEDFGCRMFTLWESLAGNLQDEKPFSTLSCTDNRLFCENKNEVKKAFEKMLSFYD